MTLPAFEEDEAVGSLDDIGAAVPWIADVWSPYAGGYDIDRKLPGSHHRGSAENRRIYPSERTVTIRRRQRVGLYKEPVDSRATRRRAAYPEITTDVDDLFGVRLRVTNL